MRRHSSACGKCCPRAKPLPATACHSSSFTVFIGVASLCLFCGRICCISAHEVNEPITRLLVNGSDAQNSLHLNVTPAYFLTSFFNITKQSMTIKELQSILTTLQTGSNIKQNRDASNATSNDNAMAKDKNRTINKDEEHICLSAEALLRIHGIESDQISASDFLLICPALIDQHISKDCLNEQLRDVVESSDASETSRRFPTLAERYGYSTVAVVIINYLPLVILISMPKVTSAAFPYVMHTFMGLATSTLVSDAMLHLLPAALGVGEHSHGGGAESKVVADGHKETGPEFAMSTLRTVLFLGVLYAMYLLEMLIGTRQRSETGGDVHSHHSHGHSHGGHGHAGHRHSIATEQSQASNTSSEVIQMSTGESNNNNDMHKKVQELHVNAAEMPVENGEKATSKHSKTTFSEYMKEWYSECIPDKAFGWMLILCDGLHNFMDGLAIGATFSTNVTDGFSTSLAILFHEIPHEIGDFAALLNAGLSWRGDMTWNLLQTVAAFVGVYIGLGVASDEESQRWIFMLTAGMFMHVSLSGLAPELHNIKEKFWTFFLLQNVGIQVGFWIMFLIAIYEEQLSHILD